MPTKKRKRYNARFPPVRKRGTHPWYVSLCIAKMHLGPFQSRIKKIMQTDEDVGKVAAAVPVLISRALELFVETLLKDVNALVEERGAKTLTPNHL